MKPEFSITDPDCSIYVGDCRTLLPELPHGLFDLVFADPPFNQGEKYPNWDDKMASHEYLDFTHEWLDVCIQAMSSRGSLWINVPDKIAARIQVYLEDKGLRMVNWCVWTFRFGVWRPSSFIVAKTHVLYFVKSMKDRIWNPKDILVTSDRVAYGDPRTKGTKNPGKRVPLDVWGSEGDDGECWGRIQGNNKERRHKHPNQLPEKYLERVIRSTSNPDSYVLDPFLGSGTTAVVARALGRPSVGVEISPVYAASAYERILKGSVRIGA